MIGIIFSYKRLEFVPQPTPVDFPLTQDRSVRPETPQKPFQKSGDLLAGISKRNNTPVDGEGAGNKCPSQSRSPLRIVSDDLFLEHGSHTDGRCGGSDIEWLGA